LGRLPILQHVRVGGLKFCLVHATPRDPLDEYLGPDLVQWQERLQGLEADFVCVGHSHLPFHLQINGVQVVNPGSVGQPRDRDPRASYAIIDEGTVTFHRVNYDIDAAVRQVRSADVPDWVSRVNEAVWRSGGGLGREELDAIL
jgi:predicted phosphodiesterase